MAKYKITDPKTGRTAVVSGDTPPTEADIDQIFAQAPAPTQTAQPQQLGGQSGLETALRNTPILGGLLTPAINTAHDIGAGIANRTSGVDEANNAALQAAQAASQRAMTETDPAQRDRLLKVAQATNNQVGQNAQQTSNSFSSDVNQNPLERGVKTGASVAGVADLPVMATNLVKNTPGMLQYLTKSGLGRKIEELGVKATQSGAADNFGDVSTEIRQAVGQKFLPTNKIANATNEIVSKLAPANLTGKVTPTDLIRGRQAVTQTYGGGPQGFMKLLGEATPEQKVGNVARGVLSKRAKDITPGLKALDFIFSRIYSNPYLGDVPTMAAKGAAGVAGAKFGLPAILSMFRGGNGS